MIKKLINSFGENDYASPRATLVELETETNILICSADGQAGGAGSAKGVEELMEGVTIDLNNP